MFVQHSDIQQWNVHFKFWLKFAKILEISSQCERANLPSELQNLSRFTLEIRSKCERTNLLVFINVGAMRLWKFKTFHI